MGATTTAVNANLAGLRGVFTDMLDAINEVNMKSWSGTTQELFELNAAQTVFIAATNPTNDTATKTSSTAVITSAAAITLFNAYKALEANTMLALEALRTKNWSEYKRLMPAVNTTYATLVTAQAAITVSAGQTTATQGAQATGMIFEFATASERMKLIADRIVPMLNARAEKNYVLVEQLYIQAIDALAAGVNDSITNVSS